MKINYLYIFLSVLLIISIQNCGTDSSGKSSDSKLRTQLIATTEKYIMSQLKDPRKTISENGTITLADEQKRFVIEQSKVFTGLIDDDLITDAILTVETFQGEYQTVSEHLIILGTENDLRLAITIESDMRIISLKDRIITADVPEHSRNTPLFNCPSCWEVAKYQFSMGELERVD
jgi:hypothetical protein